MRSTKTRDILGTIAFFIILMVIVFGFMLGELFLENFKSH